MIGQHILPLASLFTVSSLRCDQIIPIADLSDANTNIDKNTNIKNTNTNTYLKGQRIVTFCCVAPGCDQIIPVADHSDANTNLDTNTDIIQIQIQIYMEILDWSAYPRFLLCPLCLVTRSYP